MNLRINKLWFSVLVVFLVSSCLPKEQVVFKSVKNLELEAGENGQLLLKGDAIFYNPNKTQTKLKEINVDVFVDGKKTATVDQLMNLAVKGQADFTIPIQAQLSLKEMNLLDAVVNFFGGKKYQVTFTGFLRVSVHGITVRVPVKYSEELKLQ